jgi:hypothetical protein
MFPVYCGKCLSRKAIHSWSEKRGERFADEEVETEVRKWLRQQSNDFYVAGFDKCIDVGGGYVENFFFYVRI